MLKIHDVHFSYNNRPLLSGLCLELEQGDIVAITGPSGCGKSTLLQLIVGSLEPQLGKITQQALVSYMTQQPLLLPWKTLEENLCFAKDLSKKVSSLSSQEALDLVDLSGKGSLYPHQLSGGMRQRAFLAQVLLFDRPILLLDEPFSALDLITKQKIIQRLTEFFSKKQKTVIIITHQLKELAPFYPQHYLLDQGQLTLKSEAVF